MIYATIKDAKIDKIGTLSEVFPGVSFPAAGVNEEWLKKHNAQPVIMILEHDEKKQKVTPCKPYIAKDAKIYGVQIEDYTKEEADAYKQAIKNDAKLHEVVKDAK